MVQNSGLVPNQWPSRSAVSADMPRLPRMIWLILFGGTAIWRASSAGVTPITVADSSILTLPERPDGRERELMVGLAA